MALAFLAIAPLLGYKASMFNLVFANNLASIRLWRSLNFQEIGRVPNAGSLRKNQLDDEEEFVDAIMFHYSFTWYAMSTHFFLFRFFFHQHFVWFLSVGTIEIDSIRNHTSQFVRRATILVRQRCPTVVNFLFRATTMSNNRSTRRTILFVDVVIWSMSWKRKNNFFKQRRHCTSEKRI